MWVRIAPFERGQDYLSHLLPPRWEQKALNPLAATATIFTDGVSNDFYIDIQIYIYLYIYMFIHTQLWSSTL